MYRFLYNCVFGLAFINFLVYWIDLFFSSEQYQNSSLAKCDGVLSRSFPAVKKSTAFFIGLCSWVSQFIETPRNITNSFPSQASSIIGVKPTKSPGSYSKLVICSLLWFGLTLLIFYRVTQSNHFPLSNFYEALIFLTWCLVTLNLFILLDSTRSRSFQFSVQKQVSGAVLAPCILFLIAFAQFHLSSDITPLVPALKSNWLLMHVSIMICSYTTFLMAGLLALLLLIQTVSAYIQIWTTPKKVGMTYGGVTQENNRAYNKEFDNNPSISYFSSNPSLNSPPGGLTSESIWEGPYKMQKKSFYILLDNLSYRMMGIGFPLFTLGILSGAVWANEAWGSYWSWDIKEVGSFINWLLVALYFHCRYKNLVFFSHIVAFVSLMVLFFNFFGISLGIFGSSLHAYGASS